VELALLSGVMELSASHRAGRWIVVVGMLGFIWVDGSAFSAFRVMARTVPPLVGTGVRVLIAASILALIIGSMKGFHIFREVSRRQLVVCLITGAGWWGSMALLTAGEKTVPSGLAALIAAGGPLLILVLRSFFKDRVPVASYIAVAIGFIGIALLLLPGKHIGSASPVGLGLIVLAVFAVCIGSLALARTEMPDPMVSGTYIMLFGGIIVLVIGLAIGELNTFNINHISTASWFAFGYCTFIALVGTPLAAWLLYATTISVFTTYQYIAPVLAVVLGAILLHESVTALTIISAVIIVGSVAFVVRSESGGERESSLPSTGETDSTTPLRLPAELPGAD
jgi:drug/metabolite transporter (DMT)-like permease